MRVERDILIDASCEAIWELVSNPENYARFWHGLTRLERKNEEQGLCARFGSRGTRREACWAARRTASPLPWSRRRSRKP
jgi:uncharacterized protein YndB with AHSA1/START domain